MDIKINNQPLSSIACTFNGVPTIVSIEGSNDANFNYASYITINGGKTLQGDELLTINNISFSFTNNLSEANGQTIYMSASSSNNNRRMMTYYMAKALNNSVLAASYKIYPNPNNYRVYLSPINYYVATPEFTLNNLSNLSTYQGGSDTDYELNGATIVLDIYNSNSFVTQLSKKVVDNKCYFDISPILSTFTNNGEVELYDIGVNLLNSSDYNEVQLWQDFRCLNGYSVNQGKLFLLHSDFNNSFYFAQNVERGSNKISYNNTILYTFENNIVFSILKLDANYSLDITVNYLNSLFAQTHSENITVNVDEGINDITLNLNKSYFDDSTYIDVVIPFIGTIRYNIIKPLLYTNLNQRVFWRNSYGGTSFFDFNGGRSEERTTEKETYMRNNFDLYETDIRSLNKVYSNALEYEVTLQTHLMEKDGLYSLYDLINSSEVWTIINNQKYEIIVTDFSQEETSTKNIWQATITYTYSSNDSF